MYILKVWFAESFEHFWEIQNVKPREIRRGHLVEKVTVPVIDIKTRRDSPFSLTIICFKRIKVFWFQVSEYFDNIWETSWSSKVTWNYSKIMYNANISVTFFGTFPRKNMKTSRIAICYDFW